MYNIFQEFYNKAKKLISGFLSGISKLIQIIIEPEFLQKSSLKKDINEIMEQLRQLKQSHIEINNSFDMAETQYLNSEDLDVIINVIGAMEGNLALADITIISKEDGRSQTLLELLQLLNRHITSTKFKLKLEKICKSLKNIKQKINKQNAKSCFNDPDISEEQRSIENNEIKTILVPLQNKYTSIKDALKSNDIVGYLLNKMQTNLSLPYIKIEGINSILLDKLRSMTSTATRSSLIQSIDVKINFKNTDFGLIGLQDPIAKTISYVEKTCNNTPTNKPILILNGAYGSGKKAALKTIAETYGYSVNKYEASDIQDSYMNKKAARITDFFNKVIDLPNPICVFDDISNIFSKPGSLTHDTAQNERNGMIDAFFAGIEKIKDKSIPIIGITRNIETLNNRIRDASETVTFNLLKLSERENLIQNKLANLNFHDKYSVINSIAKYTDRWSVSNLNTYLDKVLTTMNESPIIFNNNLKLSAAEEEKYFIDPFVAIKKHLLSGHNLICEPIFPTLVLNKTEINYSDMVALSNSVKEEFDTILDIIKNPEPYKMFLGKINNNLLLVGPGGTGKTCFAKAIANNANITFFYFNTSDLGQHNSESIEKLRRTFDYAKSSDSIIFIDEIDAIYSLSYPEHVRNMIKTEVDGFDKENENTLIVIAATNHPERIDAAAKTRFKQVIFTLPDAVQRSTLIKKLINGFIEKGALIKYDKFKNLNETCAQLAAITDGQSYREIEPMVTKAVTMAIAKDKSRVTLDFEEVCINNTQAAPGAIKSAILNAFGIFKSLRPFKRLEEEEEEEIKAQNRNNY